VTKVSGFKCFGDVGSVYLQKRSRGKGAGVAIARSEVFPKTRKALAWVVTNLRGNNSYSYSLLYRVPDEAGWRDYHCMVDVHLLWRS